MLKLNRKDKRSVAKKSHFFSAVRGELLYPQAQPELSPLARVGGHGGDLGARGPGHEEDAGAAQQRQVQVNMRTIQKVT